MYELLRSSLHSHLTTLLVILKFNPFFCSDHQVLSQRIHLFPLWIPRIQPSGLLPDSRTPSEAQIWQSWDLCTAPPGTQRSLLWWLVHEGRVRPALWPSGVPSSRPEPGERASCKECPAWEHVNACVNQWAACSLLTPASPCSPVKTDQNKTSTQGKTETLSPELFLAWVHMRNSLATVLHSSESGWWVAESNAFSSSKNNYIGDSTCSSAAIAILGIQSLSPVWWVHNCDPTTLGSCGRRIERKFKPSLGN